MGKAWEGIPIRPLTRRHSDQGFLRAALPFMIRLILLLLRTRAKVWISLGEIPLGVLLVLTKIRGANVVYDSCSALGGDKKPDLNSTLNSISNSTLNSNAFVQSGPKKILSAWMQKLIHSWGLKHASVLVSNGVGALGLTLDVSLPQALVPTFFLPTLPRSSSASLVNTDREPPTQGGARLIYHNDFCQKNWTSDTGLTESFWALSRMPSLSLEILGGERDNNDLINSAKRVGVWDRVHFRRSVPLGEIIPILSTAHIALCLNHGQAGNHFLGGNEKIFQAIHALTPVLLSDTPEHQRLLEVYRIGELVDPTSPASVADGLRKLLGEWETYQEQCALARESWHWDAYAQGLLSFLGDDSNSVKPGESLPSKGTSPFTSKGSNR
jgi:hypothetical protein